jgi:hypothetical protein
MNENYRQKGAGITYTATDKEFLAASYGQAVHNVFLVFCHIAKRIGEEEPIEDGKLLDWFNPLYKKYSNKESKVSVITRNRFFELINHHFPFLHIIQAAGKEGTSENNLIDNAYHLKKLLELLRDFRNMNSHKIYKGSYPAVDLKFIVWLEQIFDTNIRKVKEDFFGDNVRHDIVFADQVELNFAHLRRLVKNTDNNLLDENGKKRKSAPNKNFRYKFIEEKPDRLSKYGHLFFVSLFLEKKSAVLMQKRISGLKDGRETYAKMTSEVFCRTRILMPRIRLHSQREADALVLDMVNELAKAPYPFYDQLTEEGREPFLIESSDTQENDNDSEDRAEKLVKAVRKENRFGYFALRYFDEVNAFKNLRFQIDLGSYHFHIYEATINGQQEPRHLVRRLLGFGKLNEYLPAKAPEKWKEKVKDLDYAETAETPFIRHTFPHYHLEENRIGIRFTDTPGKPYWPELETKEGGAYPKYHRAANKADVAEAFLSTNELLPMAFCHYLYSLTDEKEKTEKLVREKLYNFRKMLTELKNGELLNKVGSTNSEEEIFKVLQNNYQLSKYEVPERLIDFLKSTPRKRSFKKDFEKLECLLSETEKRQKWFKAAKEKKVTIGKAGQRELRAGDAAQWLVDDFMRFQPVSKVKDDKGNIITDLKSKPNPKKYQMLQKSLAMYALEKENLPGLFMSCNLINAKNAHPFLQVVINKNPVDWMSFYEIYLQERNRYLVKCKQDAAAKKSCTVYYHFLKIKDNGNEAAKLYEGWSIQLMLPVGLFTTAITDWFNSYASPALKTWYQEQDKKQTTERLIEKFLTLQIDDNFQPFYSELPLMYDAFKSFYCEAPIEFDAWRKKYTGGLTLAQRTALHQSEWNANYEANKNFMKDESNQADYQKKQKKIASIEIDLNILRDSEAVINRFKADFSTENISAFIAKSKKEWDSQKQFNKLREFILAPYLGRRNAIEDYRFMLNNEQLIRRIKAEDAVISFMIRHIVKECGVSITGADTPLRLKEILPLGDTSGTGILNQVKELILPLDFYESAKTGEVITSNKLGSWVIYTDDTKIKKQGNFRKLAKDRRLNNLAQYLVLGDDKDTPVKIHRKRLEHELDKYDLKRIEIIKIMHEIEQIIFDAGLFTVDKDGYKNFREMVEEVTSILQLDTDTVNAMIALRNAILHNQYPVPADMPGIKPYNPQTDEIDDKNGFLIASQFETYAEKLRDSLLNKIENYVTTNSK